MRRRDLYSDRDGICIDFFGETVDPCLVRPKSAWRPYRKTPPPEVEPILLGMLAFLHRTIGLTGPETEAFVMHAGYQASQRQIAVALGITQQSVHDRLKGAHRKCRNWVEHRGARRVAA